MQVTMLDLVYHVFLSFTLPEALTADAARWHTVLPMAVPSWKTSFVACYNACDSNVCILKATNRVNGDCWWGS